MSIHLATHLTTNGGTAEKAYRHLKTGKTGSALDIAVALSLKHGAVVGALSRLRGAGVAKVLCKARTPTSNRAPADIWTLTDDYPLDGPLQAIPTLTEPVLTIRQVRIVQHAITNRCELAAVWMGLGEGA